MIESQKVKSAWLRSTAFLTLCFFMVHTHVWAMGSEFSAVIPQSHRPPFPERNKFWNLWDLPEGIGRIQKVFRGSGNRIVIHIQDAHVNEEAQRNIAHILDYLAQRHKLSLVALEGAQGELFTELFNFFPDQKARRKVADYFLKQGRLTGPEYLAMADRPDLKLYGAEDRSLYEENRRAYLNALEYKPRDEAILLRLNKILQDISRFVFSERVREIQRRGARFRQAGELVPYVHYLAATAKRLSLPLEDYRRMQALLSLLRLEKQIDFKQAEKELEERSRNRDVPETTNLLRYLQYLRLYHSIGPPLFEEVDRLEREIKNKLFSSKEERELDQLFRFFEIYQKIFDFELTRQDADFFYDHRREFKAETFRKILAPFFVRYHFDEGLPEALNLLDQDLVRIEKFYAVALRRDRILIGHAVEKMQAEGQNMIAVITGGFHTPGIEKYLRERGHSYLVITPNIFNVDPKKEFRLYEEALRQKPLPMEQTLLEAFFLPKSSSLNDPHFQLAAPPLTIEKGAGGLTFLQQMSQEMSQPSSTFQNRETALPRLVLLTGGFTTILSSNRSPEFVVGQMRSEVRRRFEAEYQEGMNHFIDHFAGGVRIREEDGGGQANYYLQKLGGKIRASGLYPDEKSRSEIRARFAAGYGKFPEMVFGKERFFMTAAEPHRLPDSYLQALEGVLTGRSEARIPQKKNPTHFPLDSLAASLRRLQEVTGSKKKIAETQSLVSQPESILSQARPSIFDQNDFEATLQNLPPPPPLKKLQDGQKSPAETASGVAGIADKTASSGVPPVRSREILRTLLFHTAVAGVTAFVGWVLVNFVVRGAEKNTEVLPAKIVSGQTSSLETAAARRNEFEGPKVEREIEEIKAKDIQNKLDRLLEEAEAIHKATKRFDFELKELERKAQELEAALSASETFAAEAQRHIKENIIRLEQVVQWIYAGPGRSYAGDLKGELAFYRDLEKFYQEHLAGYGVVEWKQRKIVWQSVDTLLSLPQERSGGTHGSSVKKPLRKPVGIDEILFEEGRYVFNLSEKREIELGLSMPPQISLPGPEGFNEKGRLLVGRRLYDRLKGELAVQKRKLQENHRGWLEEQRKVEEEIDRLRRELNQIQDVEIKRGFRVKVYPRPSHSPPVPRSEMRVLADDLRAKIAEQIAALGKTASYRLFDEERKNAVRDFVEFHSFRKSQNEHPSVEIRREDIFQGFTALYDLDVLDFLAHQIRSGTLKESVEISELAAFAEGLKGQDKTFEDNFLYHNILEKIQGDKAREIPPADSLRLAEIKRRISEMPEEIRALSFMPEVLKAIAACEKEIERETDPGGPEKKALKIPERPPEEIQSEEPVAVDPAVLTVREVIDPKDGPAKDRPLFEALRKVAGLFSIPPEMTLDQLSQAGADETRIPTPLEMIRDPERYGAKELGALEILLRDDAVKEPAEGRSELRRPSEETPLPLYRSARGLLEAVSRFREARSDFLKVQMSTYGKNIQLQTQALDQTAVQWEEEWTAYDTRLGRILEDVKALHDLDERVRQKAAWLEGQIQKAAEQGRQFRGHDYAQDEKIAQAIGLYEVSLQRLKDIRSKSLGFEQKIKERAAGTIRTEIQRRKRRLGKEIDAFYRKVRTMVGRRPDRLSEQEIDEYRDQMTAIIDEVGRLEPRWNKERKAFRKKIQKKLEKRAPAFKPLLTQDETVLRAVADAQAVLRGKIHRINRLFKKAEKRILTLIQAIEEAGRQNQEIFFQEEVRGKEKPDSDLGGPEPPMEIERTIFEALPPEKFDQVLKQQQQQMGPSPDTFPKDADIPSESETEELRQRLADQRPALERLIEGLKDPDRPGRPLFDPSILEKDPFEGEKEGEEENAAPETDNFQPDSRPELEKNTREKSSLRLIGTLTLIFSPIFMASALIATVLAVAGNRLSWEDIWKTSPKSNPVETRPPIPPVVTEPEQDQPLLQKIPDPSEPPLSKILLPKKDPPRQKIPDREQALLQKEREEKTLKSGAARIPDGNDPKKMAEESVRRVSPLPNRLRQPPENHSPILDQEIVDILQGPHQVERERILREIYHLKNPAAMDQALRVFLEAENAVVSYEALKNYLSQWSVAWTAIEVIVSKKIPVPLSEFKSAGEVSSGKSNLWELTFHEIVNLSLENSRHFREEIETRVTPLPLYQTDPAGVRRRLLASVLAAKLKEAMPKEDNHLDFESLDTVKMSLLQLLERYADYFATLNEKGQSTFALKAVEWILQEREKHADDILASRDHRLIILAMEGTDPEYVKRLFERFGMDRSNMQPPLQVDRTHSVREVSRAYLQALRQASRDRQPVVIWQSVDGAPGHIVFLDASKNAEVIPIRQYAKTLVEAQADQPTLQFGHMVFWLWNCYGEDFSVDLLRRAIREEAGGKKIESLPTLFPLSNPHSESQYATNQKVPYGYWGKLIERIPAGSSLRLKQIFEAARAQGGYQWNGREIERQNAGTIIPIDSRAMEDALRIPAKYRGNFVPFLKIGLAEPRLVPPFDRANMMARRSELRSPSAEILESYLVLIQTLERIQEVDPKTWRLLIPRSRGLDGLLESAKPMMALAQARRSLKAEPQRFQDFLEAASEFNHSLKQLSSTSKGWAFEKLHRDLTKLMENLSAYPEEEIQTTPALPVVSPEKPIRRSVFANLIGVAIFILLLFFPDRHPFFYRRTVFPKFLPGSEIASSSPRTVADPRNDASLKTLHEFKKMPHGVIEQGSGKPGLPQRQNSKPVEILLLEDIRLAVDENQEKTEYQIWREEARNDRGTAEYRLIGTIQDPAGKSPYRDQGEWPTAEVKYHLMRILNGNYEEFALWEDSKPLPQYPEAKEKIQKRFLGKLKDPQPVRPPGRSELRGLQRTLLTAALGGILGGGAAILAMELLKHPKPSPQAARVQPPEPAKSSVKPDETPRKVTEELQKLRQQVERLEQESQGRKPVEVPKPEGIYSTPALLGNPGGAMPSYPAEGPVPDPGAAQGKFDFKIKDTKIWDPRPPKNLADAQWSLLTHGRSALLLEGFFSYPGMLQQIQGLHDWQKLAALGLQIAAVVRGTETEKKELDRWMAGRKIDFPVIFDSLPLKPPGHEPRLYYVKDGKMHLIKQPPPFSQLLSDLQKTPAPKPQDVLVRNVWKDRKPLRLTGLTGEIYAHLLKKGELTADQLSWMLSHDPDNPEVDLPFPADTFKVLHVKDFSPEERAKIDFEEFNLIQSDLKEVLALLRQPVDDMDENRLYVLDWYHYFFKPYFILYQVGGTGAQKFMRVLKEVIPLHLKVVYPNLGIKSDSDLLPYRRETAEFILRHPRNLEIWRRAGASWAEYRSAQRLPYSLSLPYVLGDAMEAVPEVMAFLKLINRQDLNFLAQRDLSGLFLLTTFRNKYFESGLLGARPEVHKGVLFGSMPLPNEVRKGRIIEFFLGSFNRLNGQNSRDNRGLGGLQRDLHFSINRVQRQEAMGILKKAAEELSAKSDLKYEDFENVFKELRAKDFISSLRRISLLEQAQIAGLIGTPFLESRRIWYEWFQVFAPEANPYDFSSRPRELYLALPDPLPSFPGSFVYTFRNLYGASAAGTAPSQLASTSALFGDFLRPAFPGMPFDVRLRFRPSTTTVFDPDTYFFFNYREPRFVEARSIDFTTYAQVSSQVNLMKFSNEARLGDFNSRFVTLAPFQGAEGRIASALLVFYLQHPEFWENPNARNLAEILGSGKGISELVQNFRRLHDIRLYQRLLEPEHELGDFLANHFLQRLLDKNLGEIIEQENQRGIALTGGAYIDRAARELREHLDTFAFDQGRGLLMPWLYPERWPLPRPANATLFDETPFRRAGIITTGTMAMFNSYMMVLIQEQLASAYAAGIMKPDTKPEDMLRFFELKLAVRDMTSVLYYEDPEKLRLSNRADRNRLSDSAAEAHHRGIPADRYNLILTLASHPEVKSEALALFNLLTGEKKRGPFVLTSENQETADLQKNFLKWWAGQRKNSEDAKQWIELFKQIAGPDLERDFLKWNNAQRSQFLERLKQIRKEGWDKLKDAPDIFSPHLKKLVPQEDHQAIPDPSGLLQALGAKDEARFQWDAERLSPHLAEALKLESRWSALTGATDSQSLVMIEWREGLHRVSEIEKLLAFFPASQHVGIYAPKGKIRSEVRQALIEIAKRNPGRTTLVTSAGSLADATIAMAQKLRLRTHDTVQLILPDEVIQSQALAPEMDQTVFDASMRLAYNPESRKILSPVVILGTQKVPFAHEVTITLQAVSEALLTAHKNQKFLSQMA